MENNTLFMQKLIESNNISIIKITNEQINELFNNFKKSQLSLINEIVEERTDIINERGKCLSLITSDYNIFEPELIGKYHNISKKLIEIDKNLKIAIDDYNELFTTTDEEKIVFK